jgi:hypothetical protein
MGPVRIHVVPGEYPIGRRVNPVTSAKGYVMGLPRGKSVPLSPARRYVCDLMHASRRVPLVAIERTLRLGELVAARASCPVRPSWFAIFLKGWGLVADERDELRRSFLTFPRSRLYQHACNVAAVAIARRVGEEDAVLPVQVRYPERHSLMALDAFIRRARTEPLERFGDYRRAMKLSKFPGPCRRLVWWAALETSGEWRARYAGTFGITSIAALGSTALHVLSPLTTTLTYGEITPDGSIPVRLFFDHRVLDGAQPADALGALEKSLQGPIRDELRGGLRLAA